MLVLSPVADQVRPVTVFLIDAAVFGVRGEVTDATNLDTRWVADHLLQMAWLGIGGGYQEDESLAMGLSLRAEPVTVLGEGAGLAAA